MWAQVIEKISSVAPTLGALIGTIVGPAGSVVGGIVGTILKAILKIDSTDATTIANALTPDNLNQLKIFEEQNKTDIEKLNIQAAQENADVVNQTYRTELASESSYVRNMRPTFGYMVVVVMSLYFLFIICTGSYAIIQLHTSFSEVFNAVNNTIVTVLPMALAVLGIYVHKRSNDKMVEQGLKPPSLFDLGKRK